MEPYEKLECSWANWNQLDPAGMVACSSGTAALHLALEALQLPPSSKVICPDLTMIAVPRAITLAGLEPVFVDCDDTLNMDTRLVTDYCLQACPEAVMFVHTYGRQANVTDVDDFFSPMPGGIPAYIEDLAEAHGVKPHPQTDAACYSFYKNKIVHGEEGGAVWFKNPSHADRARQLRSLGFTAAHDFTHIPRGHNYRMSNVHATLILDSIGYANANLIDRWQQIERLDEACPEEWRMAAPYQAPWVYTIRVPGMTLEQQSNVVTALNDVGITARHCFKPCHLQQEYALCQMVSAGKPFQRRSWTASREVIYLALVPGRPRIDQIAFRIIREALAKNA